MGPPREEAKCPTCGETRALITINDACDLAQLNRKTIYRWMTEGRLEYCVLPNGAKRIFLDSLLRVPGIPRPHAHAESRRAASGVKSAALPPPVSPPSGRPPKRKRPSSL